jgi:hypothetical protein
MKILIINAKLVLMNYTVIEILLMFDEVSVYFFG